MLGWDSISSYTAAPNTSQEICPCFRRPGFSVQLTRWLKKELFANAITQELSKHMKDKMRFFLSIVRRDGHNSLVHLHLQTSERLAGS